MIINYANGRTIEALALANREGRFRVAIRGSEDVVEFTAVDNKRWASEDGQVVRIEFAWEQQRSRETVSEFDCICPEELATELIQSLSPAIEDFKLEPAPLEALSIAAAFC